MTKIKISKIASCFFSVVALFIASSAAAATALDSDFHRVVTEIQKHCSLDCDSDFHVESQSNPEPGLKTRLHKAALDQAQIWGDTILEGDYFADGTIALEKVESISKNNQVVAYRIIYYGNAWYTGQCAFDPSRPSSLEGCKHGFIKEASFVSVDFMDKLTDQNSIATFYPN